MVTSLSYLTIEFLLLERNVLTPNLCPPHEWHENPLLHVAGWTGFVCSWSGGCHGVGLGVFRFFRQEADSQLLDSPATGWHSASWQAEHGHQL